MTTPVSGSPPVADAAAPAAPVLSAPPIPPYVSSSLESAPAKKPAEELTVEQAKFRAELARKGAGGDAYDLDLDATPADKAPKELVPTNTGCHTATTCPSNPCATNPCHTHPCSKGGGCISS